MCVYIFKITSVYIHLCSHSTNTSWFHIYSRDCLGRVVNKRFLVMEHFSLDRQIKYTACCNSAECYEEKHRWGRRFFFREGGHWDRRFKCRSLEDLRVDISVSAERRWGCGSTKCKGPEGECTYCGRGVTRLRLEECEESWNEPRDGKRGLDRRIFGGLCRNFAFFWGGWKDVGGFAQSSDILLSFDRITLVAMLRPDWRAVGWEAMSGGKGYDPEEEVMVLWITGEAMRMFWSQILDLYCRQSQNNFNWLVMEVKEGN